jgi:hypothetical protein
MQRQDNRRPIGLIKHHVFMHIIAESFVLHLLKLLTGSPPLSYEGMWSSGFNMAGRQLLQVAEGRVSMMNGDLRGAEEHLKQAGYFGVTLILHPS